MLEQRPDEAKIRAGFWGGIFCGQEYLRTVRFVDSRWIVALGEPDFYLEEPVFGLRTIFFIRPAIR